MNDEQIKEVMRLADELADACAGCDSSHFALGQRAALEAYLRTIGEPESVNAELLDALKGMVDAHAIPSSYCKERSVYDQARAAIARAESAIETPAKVSPCAGPHEVVTASAVTCPDCIAVIKHCRGVRIQPPKGED